MCGRYVLSVSLEELLAYYALDAAPDLTAADLPPRYNIPPGTDIPVIRRAPSGERVLHLLRWGLVPHWSQDASIGARLNNARGESVAEKPSFRDAFQRRRCLIPASGFYEWQTVGKVKQPFYFSAADGQPLALGGLWESWRHTDGDGDSGLLRSTCVITTGANADMAPVHDRMPVLVPRERWADWLAAPTEAIADLLMPAPAGLLHAWPVDRRMSRTAEDDAALIAPLDKVL
jgi:putative SOS response-associated peptidase YedK